MKSNLSRIRISATLALAAACAAASRAQLVWSVYSDKAQTIVNNCPAGQDLIPSGTYGPGQLIQGGVAQENAAGGSATFYIPGGTLTSAGNYAAYVDFVATNLTPVLVGPANSTSPTSVKQVAVNYNFQTTTGNGYGNFFTGAIATSGISGRILEMGLLNQASGLSSAPTSTGMFTTYGINNLMSNVGFYADIKTGTGILTAEYQAPLPTASYSGDTYGNYSTQPWNPTVTYTYSYQKLGTGNNIVGTGLVDNHPYIGGVQLFYNTTTTGAGEVNSSETGYCQFGTSSSVLADYGMEILDNAGTAPTTVIFGKGSNYNSDNPANGTCCIPNLVGGQNLLNNNYTTNSLFLGFVNYSSTPVQVTVSGVTLSTLLGTTGAVLTSVGTGYFGSNPLGVSNPDSQTALLGATGVTFAANAFESPLPAAFTYQWSFNGSAISGATSSIYTIGHAVTAADVGAYTVTAGDGTSTVTSNAAQLNVWASTVLSSPTPSSASTVAGYPVAYTVSNPGLLGTTTAKVGYQWFYTTTNPAGTPATITYSLTNGIQNDGSFVSGATSSTLVFTPMSQANLTANLAAQTLGYPYNMGTFSVQAQVVGAAGILPTGTSVTSSLVISGTTTSIGSVNTPTLGGSATSTSSTTYKAQAGTTVTFSAPSTGSPAPAVYTWSVNGTALSDGTQADGSVISGSVTPNMTITNIGSGEAGTYSAVGSLTPMTSEAAQAAQSTGSSPDNGTAYYEPATTIPTFGSAVVVPGTPTYPTLTVVTTQAVAFTTQPVAAQTVNQGGNATLTVAATGIPAPTFLWSYNGTALSDGSQADGSAISGSATSTLTVTNCQPGEAGSYTCTGTNSVNSVTSTASVLTVNYQPIITTQPSGQTVISGTTATFSVVANGVPAPTYLWSLNGTAISAATSSTLVVNPATLVSAGTYTVAVTNSQGTTTSGGAVLTVDYAPVITTQPAASQTVNSGSSVSFTVAANALPAITGYQWSFNGTALSNGSGITGATAATLTLASAAPANAGSYTVAVTNSVGTTTSSASVLTVDYQPIITTQPVASQTVNSGTSVSFSVAANAVPAISGYQWSFNGTALVNGSGVSGATGATLTINPVSSANTGSYTVAVTNAQGTTTSTTSALTVDFKPVITSQPPASLTASSGSSVSITVAANALPAISGYQWSFNGTALSNGSGITGATAPTLSISSAGPANAGSYTVAITNSVGTTTSNASVLTVDYQPIITTQPAASQTVNAGSSVSFSVVANAVPAISGYQWSFNGTPLSDGSGITGSATATLSISSATPGNAGSYAVAVTNSVGTTPSSASVLTVDYAPIITTQPAASQTVNSGSSASFSVVANAVPAISGYQWSFNGTAISAATSSTLTIPVAAPGNAGSYTVAVTNSVGTTTSTASVLTVDYQPIITTQPAASQTVNAGSGVSFSVAANAVPAISGYQWSFNGTALSNGAGVSGATSSTLSLTGLVPANSGTYTVAVTNAMGTTTSASASLTVQYINTPTAPTSQEVAQGQNVTFSAPAAGVPAPTYQWSFNGTPISGATSSSLTLNGITPANNGSYTVTATNAYGSVTSAAATLLVDVAPAVVTQPSPLSLSELTGGSFTISATIVGVPTPAYSWSLNGTALSDGTQADGSIVSGSATQTITLSNLAITESGTYVLTGTNYLGSASTSPVTVSVSNSPAAPSFIVGPPATTTVNVDGTTSIAATIAGNPSPSSSWAFNGTTLSDGPQADGSVISGSATPSLTISNVQATDGGNYVLTLTNSLGTAVSGNAFLNVQTLPVFTTQPASQTLLLNGTISLTAAANGNPAPTYQWLFNGTAIAGATSSTYSSTPAALNQSGSYSVAATNVVGTVSSNSATVTVNQAPSIITNPVAQSIDQGSSVTFTAAAIGTPAPTYQWLFNGTPIASATSSSYTIASVAPANAGAYSAVATNGVSSATSTSAQLTVYTPPAFTIQPSSQTVVVGGSVNLTGSASSNLAPTYQWFFNGTAIGGATSSSYSISSAVLANAGSYKVVATNFTSTTSNTAVLTVNAPPAITQQPASIAVTAGTSASFSVTATGTPAPTYLWAFNGTSIPAATSSTYTIVSTTTASAGSYTVTVSNVVTSVTSNAATLTINVPPVITTQPVSITATPGTTGVFTVAASGSPAPTFQWTFNGSALANGGNISGATSSTLVISNVVNANGGSYAATATNVAGSVNSNPAILTPGTIPAFTLQPVSAGTTAGSSVTFTASATAIPAPTYQWSFAGTAIAGATSSSYTVSPVGLANGGSYTVAATNVVGSTNSSAAILTIAPVISLEPVSQTVPVNGTATFQIQATGFPLPTYQWTFNGTAIANAVSPSLTVAGISLANAGNYAVTVTNSVTSVQSSAATLIVDYPPTTTPLPSSLASAYGAPIVLSVQSAGVPAPTFQWYFNGSLILGANSSTYSIAAASASVAGTYYATVSNSLGTTTTNVETVTVSLPLGAFFGTFGGGNFAVYFNGDGTGSFLAYDPVTKVVISQYTFTVDGNGNFSFTGAIGATGSASIRNAAGEAVPDIVSSAFTVTGQLAGTTLTGAVTGTASISFTGTPPSGTATVPALAGYYSLDQTGSSATLAEIVAATGQVYALLQSNSGVGAATGTVSSLGAVSVSIPVNTTSGGSTTAAVTGSITSQGMATAAITGATGTSDGTYGGGSTAVVGNSALVNTSGRANVSGGSNVAIEGFVITGSPRQFLVIGLGPQLSTYAVTGYLTAPVLNLYDSNGNNVGTNTGWQTAANSAAIAAAASTYAGVPLIAGSADSAALLTLRPGAYTAVLSGLPAGGVATSGVALLEVFDTASSGPNQILTNTSTRGFVGTGSGVLIHGFVVSGTVQSRVLVRAVGPGLTSFGVAGVLAAPSLTLYDVHGNVVASNTGWPISPDAPAMIADAAQVGAFQLATGSQDSEVLVSLAPGNYTAVVSGVNSTTGVALIEVYQLP